MEKASASAATEDQCLKDAAYWLQRADRTADPHWKVLLEAHAEVAVHYAERPHVLRYDAIRYGRDNDGRKTWKVTRHFDDGHSDSQIIDSDLEDDAYGQGLTAEHHAIQRAMVHGFRFRRDDLPTEALPKPLRMYKRFVISSADGNFLQCVYAERFEADTGCGNSFAGQRLAAFFIGKNPVVLLEGPSQYRVIQSGEFPWAE